MDTAANKAIVQRYFSEMIDKRSDKLIGEMWTEDCIVHRPKSRQPLRDARHLGRPSIVSSAHTVKSRQRFIISWPRTTLSCATYLTE